MIERLAGIVFGILMYTVAAAQTLEDRVRELERRVEQLENQVARPTSPVTAPKPVSGQSDGWRERANWRSLRRGMTESEVRSSLGEPQKVDSFPSWSSWDYPRGGGARFDRNGRLDGWSEPR